MLDDTQRNCLAATLDLVVDTTRLGEVSRIEFLDLVAKRLQASPDNREKLRALITDLDTMYGMMTGTGEFIATPPVRERHVAEIVPGQLLTTGPTLDSIIEAIPPGTRITIDRAYGEAL